MEVEDGISLQCARHPRESWLKYIWLRMFHRDINPNSLETVFLSKPLISNRGGLTIIGNTPTTGGKMPEKS